jgi:hypothetical protein
MGFVFPLTKPSVGRFVFPLTKPNPNGFVILLTIHPNRRSVFLPTKPKNPKDVFPITKTDRKTFGGKKNKHAKGRAWSFPSPPFAVPPVFSRFPF